MSFMGIFRSKKRNRVIYDSKPTSPNDETNKDTCCEAAEQAKSSEGCQETATETVPETVEEQCQCEAKEQEAPEAENCGTAEDCSTCGSGCGSNTDN